MSVDAPRSLGELIFQKIKEAEAAKAEKTGPTIPTKAIEVFSQVSSSSISRDFPPLSLSSSLMHTFRVVHPAGCSRCDVCDRSLSIIVAGRHIPAAVQEREAAKGL
jgi:hypothetical protein